MSSLSEHVSISITLNDLGIARASFGIPMTLSYTANWLERSRSYTGLDDVVVDFAIGTPEYLCAQSTFAQSPKVERMIIGRAANKPTQQYTLGAAVAVNSDPYQINLTQVGATVTNPVTFTSDGTATIQEINLGLLTALNAIVGKNYTCTFSPLPFVDFVVTADSTTDQLAKTAHGFKTGDGPIRISNAGGALPTGLVAATDYYVVEGLDVDHFKVATNLANALAGTVIDITTNGTGTQTINHQAGSVSPFVPFLATANVAGNYFSLEVLDTSLLSIKQTHADPGTVADLVAIQAQNDDWYALITPMNSKAQILATSAWIETQMKLYFPTVNETDALNTVLLNATDTGAALKTLGYDRTAPCYHPSPAAFFAAAWLGRTLAIDPGEDDWKWRSLAGVATVSMTATQRANLRARYMNTYERINGRSLTWEGTVSSGRFIDNIRGRDWLEDDMSKGVFGALGNPNKTPFDDVGIAVVQSEVLASMKRAAKAGIIDESSISVVVPTLDETSANDRALRKLTGVKFTCRFQGSIHSVDIDGTVSA